MEMYEENKFDEEERYDARQRQASAAGLLAGLFMLFLLSATVVALVKFWPI
jgi:hypothetical protein